MTERKAFVVGWPIAHSRSPLIHRFWLKQHGIAGDYLPEAVPPDAIDAFFLRVFSGGATADDLRDLRGTYGCALVVVTAQDAIWDRDPFAADPGYRLVETEPAAWRIYKPVAMAQW